MGIGPSSARHSTQTTEPSLTLCSRWDLMKRVAFSISCLATTFLSSIVSAMVRKRAMMPALTFLGGVIWRGVRGRLLVD